MTEENQIKPDLWESMNFDQLLNQKTIMLDRYIFLVEKGYREPAKMVDEGIKKIDYLLSKK